ncbi:MSMEG_1061 family FMN-dependent PPOX-type flavoprotein [Pelomonas sp. SE-A7]|uniref:MSMEG_1061 family FMN-dependent PPOX-type flavoprotein n=1 Tax=Pelomonas sp. SE-A7 TaxID=3054953 RepID=UPI00259C95B7|nr:MSMEG_1061 family FMN-dependent PPOX-type flavoprotein [Pelomonas sp. SE-A7]MDM4768247.1 pyridoxamine 5'-phosphate oxidase family protein [Pelomonas sp. SE-A7]
MDSVSALRRTYPAPDAPATLDKECDHVHPLYRPFIDAATFCVLATQAADGRLDTSPRGDARGQLVEVVDEGRTLLMPDRRGNNRIDSLRNIVHEPQVALLFLIPGIGEAIRVMGRARISAAPALLQRFAVDGDKLPRSVLVVEVDKVFFQCARAVKRSGLWDPAAQIERSSLPSTGSVLAGLSAGFDGAAYDEALPARQQATLY